MIVINLILDTATLFYMIGEIQSSKYANSKRSAASKIFIAATILIATNIALIILSAANCTQLQLQFVAIPVMISMSAILHLILAICALIGLIIITCKKHTIGHKTMSSILVFCIALTLSHIFLCITELVSEILVKTTGFAIVKMLTMAAGYIVIGLLACFYGRLYKLTSNTPLFFISERVDTITEENLYADITLSKARGRIPPLPVTLTVGRTNSTETVYEEIPLSSSPSGDPLIAYIDEFGSQEDMRTVMTNV